MYISTSHTMGTPNRRRTGPHLSPPQALMVETSRLVCALHDIDGPGLLYILLTYIKLSRRNPEQL